MKTCYFYLKMKHALKDKFFFAKHVFKHMSNSPKDEVICDSNLYTADSHIKNAQQNEESSMASGSSASLYEER